MEMGGGCQVGCLEFERHLRTVDHLRSAAYEEFWATKGGGQSKALGGPNAPALDHFVVGIWRLAWQHNCPVTIDPNKGSGTLIDFLKLAAPLLPPGLVPSELWTPDDAGSFKGLKRLQRLKKDA
jgi:hypothetical protein